MHTYRPTYIQTYRHTYMRTSMHTYIHTDRHTDIHTDKQRGTSGASHSKAQRATRVFIWSTCLHRSHVDHFLVKGSCTHRGFCLPHIPLLVPSLRWYDSYDGMDNSIPASASLASTWESCEHVDSDPSAESLLLSMACFVLQQNFHHTGPLPLFHRHDVCVGEESASLADALPVSLEAPEAHRRPPPVPVRIRCVATLWFAMLRTIKAQ